MTAKEIINAAGRLIVELRSGRTFSDTELADLLVSLNNLIASWSEEHVGIYQVSRDTLPLNGQPTYTWGTGGTLATARPVTITAAATESIAGVAMPVERIVTAQEWTQAVFDAQATGDFVSLLFPDYGMPLITLRLWPIVASGSLTLYSLKPLTGFATLADAVVLPPGYEQALVYGLAIKIAPEFGKQASPETIAIAQSSKAAIAMANAKLVAPMAA